tara:strand:- start:211 stop:1155 length:945 start_codon:yes stop_codon:yes gene_type:complete
MIRLKKPKFWDYKKRNLLSFLIQPLTLPIILNNYLLGLKTKKKHNTIKTICVGNIYVGGTGKTPTVIKIFQILKNEKFNVFTAKKFYETQKDEIKILENNTNLIINRSRSKLLKNIENEEKKILIFDDGLQDKEIKYDLEFVCFDTSSWIGNGCLIPAGPLREKLASIKKYDGIFLKEGKNDSVDIIEQIKKICDIPIFRTFYQPVNLKKFDLKKKYLIFSGIGNPAGFKQLLLKNKFNIINEIVFPDHHNYSTKTINKIKMKANSLNAEIITTEKDYIKISKENQKDINFLEIDLKIIDKDKLINFIREKLND